jgi:large subunit ribosomal protein L23
MALTVYDIIRGPVTASSKAHILNKKMQKLTVYVHPEATKTQIKEAVQLLFNVKVGKVNTLYTGDKSRKVGQRLVVRSGKKKAVITLAKGYSLDFFNQNSGSSDVTIPEAAIASETKR